MQYYDAQVDDARHTMVIARTAAAYGAHVATRTRVVGLLREGERVTGAEVRRPRVRRGRSRSAPGRSSTPPGCGPTTPRRWSGERGQFQVRASKGIHLVVPRDRIQSATGHDPAHREVGAVRHPVGPALDHRHHRHRLGPRQGPPGRAAPPTSTTCSTTSTRCCEQPLTHDDVEGVYAGSAAAAVRRVGRHVQAVPRARGRRTPCRGWWWSPGGKYTTYRVMAKDAVDEAVHGLRRRRVPPSVTEDVPLLGAEGYHGAVEPRVRHSPRDSGLHEARIEHLLQPLRVADRRGARPRRAPTRSLGEPLGGRRRLPARRGRLRRHPRGCPAPGGRARPPHPDLDRDLRPRHRRASTRSPSSWPRCSAGRTSQVDAGGRALPARGSTRSGRARRCPTTRPPTPPAWGRRRSCRCADAPVRGNRAWGHGCRPRRAGVHRVGAPRTAWRRRSRAARRRVGDRAAARPARGVTPLPGFLLPGLKALLLVALPVGNPLRVDRESGGAPRARHRARGAGDRGACRGAGGHRAGPSGRGLAWRW